VNRLGVANVLLALLGLDMLGLIVTGRLSFLAAGGIVGPWGVVWRAAAIAGLLILRFGLLPPPERRMERGRLMLFVLLCPTLVQFQILGARLSGDGISYYVYVRSLLKDRDFDLVDEYDHYGMLGRWDLAVKTRTGLRRSIYSVGPAVVWTPFFLLGEAAGRIEGAATGTVPDMSGYGRDHLNAVALGNVLYGFGALLLIHSLLLRHFPRGIALGTVLLLWGATFFHWYLVIQPTYAHSPSTLLAAYFLWLWDRDRQRETGPWTSFYQGVVLGLGMCVRWQNGALLLLPGIDMAKRALRRPAGIGRLAASSALLGVGLLLGAFPQMAAWKALYDQWLLPCPPHGCDFVRLDHPWVLETLFASRHGLLSWTPALWAGYLGFIPLTRRRPGLAATLAAPLVVMTYVNMCAGDWWGGASFSNRRFDSVLPLLAFGTAACLAALLGVVRSRPALGAAALVAPFVLWNVASDAALRQGRTRLLPAVAFSTVAGDAARATSDAIGFPTTWPASWIFALQHRISPGRYDLTVGRYLFYRQNSFGQRLDLSEAAVAPLLDGDWRPTAILAGRPARCVFTRARIFVPLDVAAAFELRFAAAAPGGARQFAASVNGHPVGTVVAGPSWGWTTLGTSADLWHREINELALEALPGPGPLCVSSVEFVRAAKKGGRRP
jgi:hypothetical protein